MECPLSLPPGHVRAVLLCALSWHNANNVIDLGDIGHDVLHNNGQRRIRLVETISCVENTDTAVKRGF